MTGFQLNGGEAAVGGGFEADTGDNNAPENNGMSSITAVAVTHVFLKPYARTGGTDTFSLSR